MKLTITLNSDALKGALHAREVRGLDIPPDFFGPSFESATLEWAIEGNLLRVTPDADDEEGVDYYYNLSNVARLKAEYK